MLSFSYGHAFQENIVQHRVMLSLSDEYSMRRWRQSMARDLTRSEGRMRGLHHLPEEVEQGGVGQGVLGHTLHHPGVPLLPATVIIKQHEQ